MDPFQPIDDEGRSYQDRLRSQYLGGGTEDAFPSEEALSTDGELVVKDEIRPLIARHGRQVYIRKRTSQRCSCRDPITGEASVDCSLCSSMGWVYLDHLSRAMKDSSTRPVSGSYRKTPTPFGLVSVDEVVIYLETTGINPSIHDWIIEVITDELGNVKRPPKIERIYDVNEVVDLRENYGQIAYWAVRARLIVLGK